MEDLKTIVLSTVQTNIQKELLKELDNRLLFTGHGLIVKGIEDVKNSVITFANNEMDRAQRRLYLLMI